jgi:hypothetical protein
MGGLLVVVGPPELVAPHDELAGIEPRHRRIAGHLGGAPQLGMGMDEIVADLERLEHRLVVLVLVLDHHVVGVAAPPQRLVVREPLRRQPAKDTPAHVGDVVVCVRRRQEAEPAALGRSCSQAL